MTLDLLEVPVETDPQVNEPGIRPSFQSLVQSLPWMTVFDVEVVPQREHHSAHLNVFMTSALGDRFQVDNLPALGLKGDTLAENAANLQRAYTQASQSVGVTETKDGWNFASPKHGAKEPLEHRFVMAHKSNETLLQNFAYVVGSKAGNVLGVDSSVAKNTVRAQMVFKF